MRAAHLVVLLVLSMVVSVAGADECAADEDSTAVTCTVFDPGAALESATLDTQRGGDEDIVHNVIEITGEVTDNTAYNVATGANSINEGSFANASGITTVVQNTGANVLIQSATILNVQFVDP